jgi:hypothetical protein
MGQAKQDKRGDEPELPSQAKRQGESRLFGVLH